MRFSRVGRPRPWTGSRSGKRGAVIWPRSCRKRDSGTRRGPEVSWRADLREIGACPFGVLERPGHRAVFGGPGVGKADQVECVGLLAEFSPMVLAEGFDIKKSRRPAGGRNPEAGISQGDSFCAGDAVALGPDERRSGHAGVCCAGWFCRDPERGNHADGLG